MPFVNWQQALVYALAMIAVYLVRRATLAMEAGAKTKEQKDALHIVSNAIQTGVLEAAQRVRDLKNPDKPGEWTKEAGETIRTVVIADARKAFPAAVDVLTRSMGAGSADGFLQRLAEAAVEKARGPQISGLIETQAIEPRAEAPTTIVNNGGGN
jgi:hypothetical protein